MNPNNVDALYDNIVVEVIKNAGDDKTASGIILSDRPSWYGRGKVVSVGSGVPLQNGTRTKMDVEIGDVVYYNDTMAWPLDKNDGKPALYVLIKETHLVARDRK